MTWWVIVNPAAGVPGELTKRTQSALSSLGIEFKILESRSPENVAELISAGRDAGIRQFAGVGGDGTAHLLVNGLLQHEWPTPPGLAVLPAGSGSDFIRTFALPRSLEKAAPHLATDDWYRTDVLCVCGSFGTRYALNVVEAGVGAAAVTTVAKVPRWLGARRYALAFWLTLPGFKPGTVTATVDTDKRVAGPAIAVIVANGQFFGGGMNIAPRASVSDGTFDLQVFSGPRRKALTVMPRVVRGMHLRHKNVRRIIGETVDLEVPDGWPIEADGELLGTGPISVSVLPGAIEFKI
jgi:YegS/Rv2252/BmrU family lipid kinase